MEKETIHRTRRDRFCFSCGAVIRAGDEYRRRTIFSQQRIVTQATCRSCPPETLAASPQLQLSLSPAV